MDGILFGPPVLWLGRLAAFGATLLLHSTVIILTGLAGAGLLRALRKGAAARSMVLRLCLCAVLAAPAVPPVIRALDLARVRLVLPLPESVRTAVPFEAERFADPPAGTVSSGSDPASKPSAAKNAPLPVPLSVRSRPVPMRAVVRAINRGPHDSCEVNPSNAPSAGGVPMGRLFAFPPPFSDTPSRPEKRVSRRWPFRVDLFIILHYTEYIHPSKRAAAPVRHAAAPRIQGRRDLWH